MGEFHLLVETKPKLKKVAEDLSPCKKKSGLSSIQGHTQTLLWGGRAGMKNSVWQIVLTTDEYSVVSTNSISLSSVNIALL